jgi:hypothetical protein
MLELIQDELDADRLAGTRERAFVSAEEGQMYIRSIQGAGTLVSVRLPPVANEGERGCTGS